MGYEYGFGTLEDELITLLTCSAPDFQKAEELLARGANLNALPKNLYHDNILATILEEYWYSVFGGMDEFVQLDIHEENPRNYARADELVGQNMVKIVQLFLEKGFDVSKKEGRYGAACLAALVTSTFDQYILEAAHFLLDAGAVNTIYDDDGETVINRIAGAGSFQDNCEHDHHLGNIYEAFYQMVDAKDKGRPYQGIDFYQACYGKRIKKVLAEKPHEGIVFFDIKSPHFEKKTTAFAPNSILNMMKDF